MQAYSPATVLAMARAFSAERENLNRDVIFVLDGAETMASIGEASVISAFGPARQNAATHKKISDSIEKNAKELQLLERLLALSQSPGFFVDVDSSISLLDSLAKEELKRLDEELHYVFGQMVFKSVDQVIDKLVALKRLPGVVSSGPEYDGFMSAIGRENTLKSAISSSSHTLVKRQGKIIQEFAIREKLTARLQHLIDHLKDKQKVLETDREINGLAKSYNSFFVLSPRLLPAIDSSTSEAVAFLPSSNPTDPAASSVNPQTSALSNWTRKGQLEKKLPEKLKMVFLTKGFAQTILPGVAGMPVSTALWREFAYPAYQLVNLERRSAYQDLSLPDKPSTANPASMDSSLRFLGLVANSIAKGTIPISLSTFPKARN
jgi:hypothetical protein